MYIKVYMSMKEKKLGGRPKLASYQKRTKCFRVMFTENDYMQWAVKSVSASVRKWCRQSVTFPV